MELWDVYDENRQLTDRTMVRGEEIKPGDYHIVVHCCIFNSRGEMLIQKRKATKKQWPNLWDITISGSAIKGETSSQAIERELSEELSLKLDFKNVRPHLTVNFDCGFHDIYLLEKDVDLNTLTLQQEEVEEVRFATLEEIEAMIDNGTFMHYYKNLIKIFFDMRKHLGIQEH